MWKRRRRRSFSNTFRPQVRDNQMNCRTTSKSADSRVLQWSALKGKREEQHRKKKARKERERLVKENTVWDVWPSHCSPSRLGLLPAAPSASGEAFRARGLDERLPCCVPAPRRQPQAIYKVPCWAELWPSLQELLPGDGWNTGPLSPPTTITAARAHNAWLSPWLYCRHHATVAYKQQSA